MNVSRTGIEYIKTWLNACLVIKCHPSKLRIDTIDNLHLLPCIVKCINAAISSLILVPFLHGCLIGAVQEYVSCKSPLLLVAVKEINQILYCI